MEKWHVVVLLLIRIDLIQDMLIEDILPYFWLMKQREKVNYQLNE